MGSRASKNNCCQSYQQPISCGSSFPMPSPMMAPPMMPPPMMAPPMMAPPMMAPPMMSSPCGQSMGSFPQGGYGGFGQGMSLGFGQQYGQGFGQQYGLGSFGSPMGSYGSSGCQGYGHY